jgi:beta-lactamase regulating signal transducer with metallopeptidase domain
MESLWTHLSEQTIRQIGWVLVHFLWQGLAAAAIMWAVLKVLAKSTAGVRYITACAGMLLMASAPVITFVAMHEPTTALPAVTESVKSAETHFEAPPAKAIVLTPEAEPEPAVKPLCAILEEKLETALPWCVVAWAAGVAALSLWYLGGWCQLQKLRLIGTRPASEQIAAQTLELAQRLGVTRAVRLTESVLVQVPTMIGWLKPVILLPATALTGLDEMQLRAMIAHELAHVRRHDYLANMFQTAVEILGFYHPAVWWMSKQIRIERENCCDDIAADLVQDRTAYARALFSMEEIRVQQLALALRASGGSLIDRISRLVGKTETVSTKSGWIASAATLLVVCGLLVSASMAMNKKADETNADIDSNKLITYSVDRKVSEYPEAEDFSTPESAYAAINRVMASGSREGWMRVSTKANAQQIAQSQRQDQPVPAEWAKVVLNARILEVRIQGGRAMVIAEFPQELSSKKIAGPIDARSLKLEDGKWLNAGEDRFDTVEEAARKFGALMEREDKTENAYRTALDDPSRFKQMAEELFDKLRSADYEEILSYYDTYSGHWRQDGWKKLDLDYRVYTNWPSFAVWVCQTFKGNPIASVELGDVFLSDKEFDGNKAPAVPYKLTLQDGSVLQGDLYFAWRASSGTWQPAEGIDWHLQTGERVREAEKLNEIGVQFLAWAIERNDRFPQSFEDIQWHDPALKTWALTHMEYVGANERADVSDAAQKVIAWDKVLPETQNGTNVLFADHHVEFVSLETLNSLLQKQSGGTLGGLGGGMGGFGSTPKSDPPGEITFPRNWIEITQAQREDPNRLQAEFGSVGGMQIVVYDITDLLGGSFDQDYQPGQAGFNRAAEHLIKEIEAIVPESWRANGGQGQVNVHGTTKLMIRQTPDVHKKIADYLAQRRIQVAIEARFLLLGELFEGSNEDAERQGQVIEGFANSDEIKAAMETKPLAERNLPTIEHKPPQKVDSETEQSIIRAAQQFRNSRVLTAPKAMVLNFESASMRVGKTHAFVDAANETREIDQGVVLDLLPVVQDDNKTILLKTHIQVTDILEERKQVIDGKEYAIPWVQVTTIPFQAQVESGGTILVGGPKISAKNEQTGELEKQRLYVLLKATVVPAPETIKPGAHNRCHGNATDPVAGVSKRAGSLRGTGCPRSHIAFCHIIRFNSFGMPL